MNKSMNQSNSMGHGASSITNSVSQISSTSNQSSLAFEKTIANPACTLQDAIENIDIGGPTLLRASAKNFQDVTVIVDPADYPQVVSEIKEYGNTTLVTRFRLAAKDGSAIQPFTSLNTTRFITSTQSDPPNAPVHSYHWIKIMSLAKP